MDDSESSGGMQQVPELRLGSQAPLSVNTDVEQKELRNDSTVSQSESVSALRATLQTESETEPVANEPIKPDVILTDQQTGSTTGPTADEQMESEESIMDEQNESNQPLIADGKADSDAAHIAAHIADDQMAHDKAQVADEEMEMNEPFVADKQSESDTACIVDNQTESELPYIVNDQNKSDSILIRDEHIGSDKLLIVNEDTEPDADDEMAYDKVPIADEQAKSDTPLITDDHIEYLKSLPADNKTESCSTLPVVEEQMETDEQVIADEQMKSSCALFVDEPTKHAIATNIDDQLISDISTIAVEEQESVIAPIANEQMETYEPAVETESNDSSIVNEPTDSYTTPLGDERREYDTAHVSDSSLNESKQTKSDTDEQIGADVTQSLVESTESYQTHNTNEKMGSDNAPIATITLEQTESDKIPIADEKTASNADRTDLNIAPVSNDMESCTTPDAIGKTESLTAPDVDELCERSAPPPIADEHSISESELCIDEPAQSVTALIIDTPMQSNTTPIADEETESNADTRTDLNIHVAPVSDEMESCTTPDAIDKTESLTAPDVDELCERSVSPVADEHSISGSELFVDEPAQSVTALIKDKPMQPNTTPAADEETESLTAPDVDELCERSASPIADEHSISGSELFVDDQAQSVAALIKDTPMQSNTTPIADEETESITAPISNEQMETESAPGSDEQTQYNASLIPDTQNGSDAAMVDSQTESDAAVIDSQTESDAPLIIDEWIESGTDSKAAEQRETETALDDSYALDELSDSSSGAASSEEEMEGIVGATMVSDTSAEDKMTDDDSHQSSVTRKEGIVLESTPVEDGGDYSAIVVQEQRSIRQLAASQIVDSYLDEPTEEECNAENANTNIDNTNKNYDPVLRMDLKGGTAIIDHISNCMRFSSGAVNWVESPSKKPKRPSPEGRRSTTNKRPRYDEESGKSSGAQSSLSGGKDVVQNTCDRVPSTTQGQGRLHIQRFTSVEKVDGHSKLIKIVTDPEHDYSSVSLASTTSAKAPTSASSVPCASTRLFLPPTSRSSVPNASTRLVPPSTNVSTVPINSVRPMPKLTTINTTPIASTQFFLNRQNAVSRAPVQSFPVQTSVSTVPVASMPPLTSLSTVPTESTRFGSLNPAVRLILPPTQENAVPMAPMQSIPLQTSTSTVPAAPTGCSSAPQPFTYSYMNMPPAQPPVRFQAAPIIVNQKQPVANPHCPGILHLQYNQLPPSQRDQVLRPSFTLLQNCQAKEGKQCIQQTSATKPNPPATISNPRPSVQSAFLQYQQTAHSTILCPSKNKPNDPHPATSSCQFRECSPSNDKKATTTVNSGRAPQHHKTSVNPSGSSPSASSLDTTPKNQQHSMRVEFTSVKIAVPTTMPAWVLVNPHLLTTSSSSLNPVVNSPQSLHPHVASQVFREVSTVANAEVHNYVTQLDSCESSVPREVSIAATPQVHNHVTQLGSSESPVPREVHTAVVHNHVTQLDSCESPVPREVRTAVVHNRVTQLDLCESPVPREVNTAATSEVHNHVTQFDSCESPVILERANINKEGMKRPCEDVTGDQSKRSRIMNEGEMLVERLQKVSAHRLYVVLEVLKFVTSNRFGPLYNPAVRDLTPEELHAFSVLFAAVYGYRICIEAQIKRILTDVAALTIHNIGADEPRRVQEAVNSFSDVGLAKSEKLNRLSQVLFSDYERAFCSATGKEGYAPFCKSRLFVLQHAYAITIGENVSTPMSEGERIRVMKHVLDSTANLLRIQMTKEGSYTDPQLVKIWMSKEQERVRTILCKKQKELAEQRKLAEEASVSWNYLMESQLGCYVMTASEYGMLEDIRNPGNQALSKKQQVEQLLETILSPDELLLIAKKTEMPELSGVGVKLAFLRQAFFAICYGESCTLTAPIAKVESVKEWLMARVLMKKILERIEAESATLRCLMLPTEVRIKSHRKLKSELKENMKQGYPSTSRACKQDSIRSAQGIEKSPGFETMLPENLGAYVMSKVIAVHLDVVKEIADRGKRESILQHILTKIITEEGNVQNQSADSRSVAMYLAVLRQCIFIVFSHDTHEVQCGIWKRCTNHMASLLGSSSEVSSSGIVNNVRIKEENVRDNAYSFLGCPCRKEELGAMVLNADEVAEINHIRDNIQGSSDSQAREVAVNQLVMNLINQEDISSVPVCLALRKLPFKILKLTKIRSSYFSLFPLCNPEAEESEWAHCWSSLARSVQSMMLNNRRFVSLISVPRTFVSKMDTRDQNKTDDSDDDSSQSGGMSNSSYSSSSEEKEKGDEGDEDIPLFIHTGAVMSEGQKMSESPKSWNLQKRRAWQKTRTDRLPTTSRVAETESGEEVPLPLGTPMSLGKIGSHVMTSKEENWKKKLKHTCHIQQLTREQVVQLVVKELYSKDDIINIHHRKRAKQTVFCPLKMAILRQVYFELYDNCTVDPFQLWCQCWAHLARVVDKIRQMVRNTLLGKVVLTEKYKRLKKLQIRKEKLQQEYRKRHIKRTRDSQRQVGRPKKGRANTDHLHASQLNMNVTCASNANSIIEDDVQEYRKRHIKKTGGSQRQVGRPKKGRANTDHLHASQLNMNVTRASNANSIIEDDVPFFTKSGTSVPVVINASDKVSSGPVSCGDERGQPYTLITEEGETVALVYGRPVTESNLGATVMTQEEGNWTQTLKEACRERNIAKGEAVEFITQNVYTVPEIRRFHERRRRKQRVFDRMKIAIIRKVYFSIFPPESDEAADILWWNFWAYFTIACQNLEKNGRTLPHAISELRPSHRVKATQQRPLLLDRAKPKKQKHANKIRSGDVIGQASELQRKGITEKGALSRPNASGSGTHHESQLTLRPQFMSLLQCYSWNPDILVRFLAAYIFTEDELLGCAKNLRSLDSFKMKVFETGYSQFYDPADSAASCCLINHIQDLNEATASDYWGRQTPQKIQVMVEKCAKQCEYTFSAEETNQELCRTEPASTSIEKSTFSAAERSKMCREILDDELKNLPQYKFERCVYVACKLMEKMFSREELLTGNTAGTRGLCTLDPKRLAVLKCTTFAIAGIAPSAHQRTWDRIHNDIDQALKYKGSHFVTEDRKVEKELECATVLISSKSRIQAQKQDSETGFQMISCTTLIKGGLRRDLLLCAEDHSEVLKKLLNHFIRKDEDYDQFLYRAPSKMKLIRAVYWSICSISIDKLGESWIEAMKTISYLVESGKLYEKPIRSNDELEESESTKSGDESTQLQDKTNPSKYMYAQQEAESKLRQLRSIGDVKETSIRLMKCYKWSKEVVVRLLIQRILTETEIDNVAKNMELHEKKRIEIEAVFSQVYGEEEKDQCWTLIKQIIEDVCKENRSSLCNVWTRKSKKTAVEEAAHATLYKNTESKTESQRSADLDCDAFIQEEFPWLPSGEVGKCLFISDHMRKSFFSTEELAFGSCSGTPGWLQLDPIRMDVLKHVVFTVASVPEHKEEKLWQMCSNTIDKKNRKLRQQILHEDEKVETLIHTSPSALEEQITDDARGHVTESKDNAVTVIRSLVQQLFNPEDLMGDADEMTPSQMKLLQALFFKIHEVVPTEKENAWIQAMRTINYLNKISGYTFKSGDDGDSSGSFISDKEDDWTGGMDDYPEGGESSDEDMAPEPTERVFPKKEKAPSEPISGKNTSCETTSKSAGQTTHVIDSTTSRISENDVGQCSGTSSREDKMKQVDDITVDSLDWYILRPGLVQLYKHLTAYKLEEDEIVDELIMHIFGAKLLDGQSAALSLDESIEMLKSAFFLLYNVPGNEQAAANDLLEERLMHTLMILGQQLTQVMDESLVENETTVKVLNKPKPYPPMSDLEGKVKKMRSLLMEAFRADERVEMDSAKLKKLRGSKVDAVIDAFQKSFPSQESMERKLVMTLIYNLTVELQELVTEKLRYKVDSLTNAYVQRAVSALEAKAKEQATSTSSATPFFQAVIQELVCVQRAVGVVPMVRVLLRYLFTPEELVALQQSDMTQLPPSLQAQMNLMQRTFFKVIKTPSSERENAWSCIQWIIAKEVQDCKSSDEESNKKKVKSETFVPVYHRCAVMKCVMGIILPLEEQSQFHADPQGFETSHPDKIKEMKNLYFLIRNIQEHAKEEEWELVCTPKKNYEVAQQLSFPNKSNREHKVTGLGTSKNTVTSTTLEDKSNIKISAGVGGKKQVQEPKSVKMQTQKPQKMADVMHMDGEKPIGIRQSKVKTRSKSKGVSENYISLLGGKKDKSVQPTTDQRTDSTNPPPTSPKATVKALQHKKTIVVLVDYSICDRVCKIMADEESKKNENVRTVSDKERKSETSPSSSSTTNTSQTQIGDDDTRAKVESSVKNSIDSENSDRVASNSSPEKNPLETAEATSVKDGQDQDLSITDFTVHESNLNGTAIQNSFVEENTGTRRSKDVDQIELAVDLLKSAVENIPSRSDLHDDASHHSREDGELPSNEEVKKEESSTLVDGQATSNNPLSPQADSPNASSNKGISLESNAVISEGEKSMKTNVLSAAPSVPDDDDDILGKGNEDDASSDLDDDLLGANSDRELQIDECSGTQTASSNDSQMNEQSMLDSGKDPKVVADVTAHFLSPSVDTPGTCGIVTSACKDFSFVNLSSDDVIEENCNQCPTDISKDSPSNMVNEHSGRTNVRSDDCLSPNTCLAQKDEGGATMEVKSQVADGETEDEQETEMMPALGSNGPQPPPSSSADILLWASEVKNQPKEKSNVGNDETKGDPEHQSDSNPESNVDILSWATQVKVSSDSTS
ncbi:uncharacterized protein LOC115918003 [Strongylocentrotus purpuratus]|uniref:BEN domain-containing protein n=1 Tax=Strongylocentrotus purpuratus TaxID=7668 RepID=A0A7M7SYT3_STRPU|nr:uncharacterized protein LOC115918003 [Strongylocentrotus purpuratus]XP_030841357.1 uncharacterized protein LOC115918003 [Strongylocentrotus purpuratus]